MIRKSLSAIGIVVFLMTVGSPSLLAQGGSGGTSGSSSPRDWSKALVDSTLTRYPDATKFGGWGYARSLYLFGQYLVYKRTHDPRYLNYIKQWIDTHIDENGKLDREINALDYVLPANLLIILTTRRARRNTRRLSKFSGIASTIIRERQMEDFGTRRCRAGSGSFGEMGSSWACPSSSATDGH